MASVAHKRRVQSLEAALRGQLVAEDDHALASDPALIFARMGMEPDPWQADLLRTQPQRALLLCTRQAGKSTATAAMACHAAIYNPGSLTLILAPAQRQSGELFRKVLDFYNALGQPVPADSTTALQLHLANGSRIIALPGKEATLRGYSGVNLLLIDEAARVEDALYFSVLPMLAVSGGRLVAMTTPFGKRGFFHTEWHEGSDWQRVKVTAYDCPRISSEFLEEARATMGDWWFRQEFMCEFRETTDQVFAYEYIDAAITSAVQPLFGVTA